MTPPRRPAHAAWLQVSNKISNRVHYFMWWGLIVIGGPGVGKTSLVHQMTQYRFAQDANCRGNELYLRRVVHGDKVCEVNLMDTTERFEYPYSMRGFHLSHRRGCIIVFDITSQNTLRRARGDYEAANKQ